MRTFSSIFFTAITATLMLMVSNTYGKERCVIDDSDRQVCVENTSLKIISLAPGSTELLFAAGAGQQVVAVDLHSDFPPEVMNLPRVGGFPNVNVESVVSFKPDLVVVWTGGNSQSVTRQLEALKIKTFHINARDFAGIERNIRQLGQIAGSESVANKAADTFIQRLAALKERYQGQTQLSVFIDVWRDPPMSIGGGQVITDVIKVCGGRNLFEEVAQPTVQVNLEQLIIDNPDVIISFDRLGSGSETYKDMMEYWQRWENMSAVKHHQLFSVPINSIARSTPRILDGTEIICKHLQAVRAKSPVLKNMTQNSQNIQ